VMKEIKDLESQLNEELEKLENQVGFVDFPAAYAMLCSMSHDRTKLEYWHSSQGTKVGSSLRNRRYFLIVG
jgi:hypothetical protein